jgi:hypothetical protein
MTNNERQKAFKDRMYEAGYKQKIVWVLRDPDEGTRISRETFLKRFGKLTAGWSGKSLSGLFRLILSMLERLEAPKTE